MQELTPAGTGMRLIYLDWIRVTAFGLLILYHVGMFYVTWDWHVKSDHVGHALEPLMLATNPWRLTLLFLVSGVATRFMADKLAPGALAGQRTMRLLLPLLFGMLIIVPPQSYYEVVEQVGYSDGYLAFWGRYLSADQSFCDADGCLILPTWNHLWFVAYLLVYTLLLTAMLKAARGPLIRFGDRLAASLTGLRLLVWPILFLAAARLILLPMFEVTHALVDDWYNHAVSFAAFLFGFLLMKKRSVTDDLVRLRWIALGLFAVCYAAYASYVWAYRAEDAIAPEALRMAMRLVYAADQWCAIVAILGFGARHLTRDSRLLRTLTQAVFPFYIAHQTIIVVAGHHLKAAGLPALVEGTLLVAITAAGCWLTYEIARSVTPLRPLLGLGPRKRPARRHTLDPVAVAD
ncbi:acyltransferase family protein [Sphingosinicella humi]|nr:acyltransferase [Sphingosinicella humi]